MTKSITHAAHELLGPCALEFCASSRLSPGFQTTCYQPPNGVEPLSEILQIWSDGLFGGFSYVHVCVWLMERGPIGWHCRMELEFIEAQSHLEHGVCR